MKIGIDVTGIWGTETGLISGIMTYTINITNQLIAIDKKNKYHLYCRDNIPSFFQNMPSEVSFRTLEASNRKMLQQLNLPRTIKSDKLDLMFFPFHSASIYCPCKSVVTIHDLFPYVVPEKFKKTHDVEFHGSKIKSFLNKAYWKMMLKVVCKRANQIIAVSKATKNDIVRIFKINPIKIKVIYEGVDFTKFDPDSNKNELCNFRQKYTLPDKYILCVGTHAYKNIEGIIKSFRMINEKFGDDYKLVIAGHKGFVAKEIFRTIDHLNLKDAIVFTNYFPDQDMKFLYQCSELFLFPSFYEGFGLPVLEAFACGTPVVTSKRGSLPEVGGEAALLVDPDKPEDIAAAVIRFLTDGNLRKEKRQLGFKQIENFSWDNAAKKTLEIFF